MGEHTQELLNSHTWVDTGMSIQYCRVCNAKCRLQAGDRILEEGDYYCPAASQKYWSYRDHDESDDYFLSFP